MWGGWPSRPGVQLPPGHPSLEGASTRPQRPASTVGKAGTLPTPGLSCTSVPFGPLSLVIRITTPQAQDPRSLFQMDTRLITSPLGTEAPGRCDPSAQRPWQKWILEVMGFRSIKPLASDRRVRLHSGRRRMLGAGSHSEGAGRWGQVLRNPEGLR